MTKKTIITTLFIFFYVFADAQADVEKNLKRYWYYRDRLEKEYMIVGMPEKQGTNWPFSSRFVYGTHALGWGENPTQDFGTYLGVLATEYRLLKDYKQNAKASETLQKLAWALESFDRVDLNCEKFFRYRIESGLFENNPNFWDTINYYKKPSDLNGCFLRGDFDGPCNYACCYDTLRCGANLPDTVYPLNPDAYITTYNNNQLSHINGVEILDAVGYGTGHVTATNKTVMSQDEVWGLFNGLAFVSKFVDDSKTFTDLEGNNVTVQQWAKNITYRITMFMKKEYTSYTGPLLWTLSVQIGNSIYPFNIHFYPIHHGGIVADAYDFAGAANKICNMSGSGFQDERSLATFPLSKTLLDFRVMHTQLMKDLPFNIHIGDFSGRPYGPMSLALISKRKNFYYYRDLFNLCSLEFGTMAFERLPIVYCLLHDKNIRNLIVPLEYKKYKKDYLNLLSKATDCGPWIIDRNHVVKALSSREWFYNRWEDNPPNNEPLDEMNTKWIHTSQANGLDYMILHNLYWLGFLDENMNDYEESVVVNHDYPWWWYGTDSNPKVIKGRTITSNKVVESNGNLTLIASESVTLNEGFDAKQGSNFDAYLKPYYHYISYDPGCPCFFERPEFDKNYVSKDTVINTGKNSRIVTENKTEEKNKDISSIENDKLTEKVIISPNPFNNQLFIYSTGEINKNTSVQIYNNLGVLVFEDYNINSFKTINTSEFSAGLYIVKIKTQDKILTYKIIKQ